LSLEEFEQYQPSPEKSDGFLFLVLEVL